MDFVGVFGIILLLISLAIFLNSPFEAENKNCPEDVKSAKLNKISAIAVLTSGTICILTWLIAHLIN